MRNQDKSLPIVKERSSNIEILRIMAMAMIVVYHLIFHCVRIQLSDPVSVGLFDNGYFCSPQFFPKLFVVEFILTFGTTANAIFILISGFFMIRKRDDVDIGRISRKLVSQLIFACVSLVVGSTVYYKFHIPNADDLMNRRSINDFNSMSWFVGYYLAVMVIAKLFLNKLLVKLNRSAYKSFLWVAFAIVSIGWSGGLLEGLGSGLRTLLTGVFLYALGGYIQLFNPFGKIRIASLLLIVIACYGLVYLSWYNVVQNSIHSFNGDDLYYQPMLLFDNYQLIPILLATILFELFRRFRIRNSKWINRIAGTTFMVYLISDNTFWYCLWRNDDWIKPLFYDPVQFGVMLIKWSALLYGLGIILYLIYWVIIKLITKCKGIFIYK